MNNVNEINFSSFHFIQSQFLLNSIDLVVYQMIKIYLPNICYTFIELLFVFFILFFVSFQHFQFAFCYNTQVFCFAIHFGFCIVKILSVSQFNLLLWIGLDAFFLLIFIHQFNSFFDEHNNCFLPSIFN